jgi:hypothetical protein
MSGRSSPPDGEADDFTQISGIGKILDRRLHEAGVNSYADLAALNPEGIASLLAEPAAVRPGRIADEDWTGQAARLAAETAETAEDQPGAAGEQAGDDIPPTAQGVSGGAPKASAASAAADAADPHYQSFVVRILLHESNGRIASTTVQHVGSGTERRWPGLDKTALLDFISSYLPPGAADPLSVRQAGRTAVPGPREAPTPGSGPAVRPQGEHAARSAQAGAAARAAGGEPALRPVALAPTSAPGAGAGPAPGPGGRPAPGEVSLALVRDLRVPRPDEPFTLSVTLDLTGVEPPTEPRIRYSAMVLARPLSGAATHVVVEGKGIVSADTPLITLHSTGLPAGTYRLEAVIQLIEPHGGGRDLLASAEGGILVVTGPTARRSAERPLQGIT